MELSSPVSMETCDCLQSSESDRGAQVLEANPSCQKRASVQATVVQAVCMDSWHLTARARGQLLS